ncbi:MAG: DUF1559 domain-containing protein [Candidatus Omnitrophica bacterium]|nr:DUF1559 domain-containing protein [Candidatus Omnitrophota bacterium]
MLLPVLSRAREQSRRAVCQNNLKQLYLSMMMYAEDYDGWGIPGISWGTPNGFSFPSNAAWVNSYFPNPQMFRCPSTDLALFKAGASVYRPGNRTSTAQYTSYWLLFGTADYPVAGIPMLGANRYFYGWVAYIQALPGPNPMIGALIGVPCPNIKFCGKSVRDPVVSGTLEQYVRPASQQACLIDGYSRAGYWVAYGYTATGVKNNHIDGENVLFMDGHVEWKAKDQVQIAFPYYYSAAQGPGGTPPNPQASIVW